MKPNKQVVFLLTL